MAIIGISGKISSGKDEIGRIMQYLTRNENYSEMSYTEFNSLNGLALHHPIHRFKVKKFAGKLKQMVAILTGCTVEELESQEFKDQYLGEEWDFYRKGLHLRPCSVDEDIRKEMGLGRIYKMRYRDLLQRIGTEAMRNMIHENVWVNALFADYKIEGCKNNGNKCETPNGDCNSKHCYPTWIITDMRFPNELKAIKDRDGITIRVQRGAQTNIGHSSETALDSEEFDYNIDNNGSIEDLIEKVKLILKTEGYGIESKT